MSLASLGRAAIDLLYPPRCALCGRGGDLLCDACLAELPATLGARCDGCWSPLEPYGTCPACAGHAFAFSRVRAALRYTGDVRRLVHAFKFDYQSGLAPRLAQPLLAAWQRLDFPAGLIVPVPLTGMHRRQRGFNQSALLARELSHASNVPVVEALQRRHAHGRQAQSRSALERWRNVEDAFAPARGANVAGKSIVLVDDIITTGATLDACARALLAAGAAGVAAVTLARED
jgi:ComF family protein